MSDYTSRTEQLRPRILAQLKIPELSQSAKGRSFVECIEKEGATIGGRRRFASI
jgi:hypothetical protein